MSRMTVSDVISQLSTLPPKTPVIIAKDGEGNGFSPASGITQERYKEETTWSGELVKRGGVKCVVIWPVN